MSGRTRSAYGALALVCLWCAVSGFWASVGGSIAWCAPQQAGPVHVQVSTAEELVQAVARVGPGGGIIALRPGSYVVDKPLVFRQVHSLQVQGSGWSTCIRTRGAIDALVFEDCAFCVVRDVFICADSQPDTGSGIVFRGRCSSNTVDFCRICQFGDSGVLFDGVADGPQSSNTISRCHFIDNRGAQLHSRHNNDFFFVQNQFGAHRYMGERAPEHGALLDHSSAGTYTANYHWSNRVALRMTGGCHYNRLENNRFEMSYEQGVVLGGAGEEALWMNILSGNTFHTNSQGKSGEYAAVEAHSACDTTFCGNQVFSWNSATYRHRHSLWLAPGCRDWIVTGNIFRHNAAEAIRSDAAKNTIIRDNLADEG